MNKELQDKLDWLTSQNVDPRRSQIHDYLTDAGKMVDSIFCVDRCTTVYYDNLANWIIEYIEELDNIADPLLKPFRERNVEQIVNAIYTDAKENNMWGYVFDW